MERDLPPTLDPEEVVWRYPGDLAAVADLMDELHVPVGSVLAREGVQAFDVFIVVEGKATVTICGRIVGRLEAGDVVGELLFSGLGASSATVIAETPMRLLATDPRRFASLIGLTRLAQVIGRSLVARLKSSELDAAPETPEDDVRRTDRAS